MENILQVMANFIIHTIQGGGYWAVAGLMAIESANIPLPSEVIMPFSGYLVSQGTLNLWWTATAGAIGCVIGSIFSYWLGMIGGRPLIERFGKYVLISHKDLDRADRWFQKHGEAAIFFSRLLPVIRTFISFPAGIARMHFGRFVLYSFVGSFPWTLALAYLGVRLGQNWERIRGSFRGLDYLILALILIGIIWYVWRHLKNIKELSSEKQKGSKKTSR